MQENYINLQEKKKIKYYGKFNTNELSMKLSLGTPPPDERFERYCKENINKNKPIIVKKQKTREEKEYKSIHKAGKSNRKISLFYYLFFKEMWRRS